MSAENCEIEIISITLVFVPYLGALIPTTTKGIEVNIFTALSARCLSPAMSEHQDLIPIAREESRM